jgi:hypothetical protein
MVKRQQNSSALPRTSDQIRSSTRHKIGFDEVNLYTDWERDLPRFTRIYFGRVSDARERAKMIRSVLRQRREAAQYVAEVEYIMGLKHKQPKQGPSLEPCDLGLRQPDEDDSGVSL